MIDKAKHDDLEAIYKLVCTLEKTQINKERFVRLYNESLTNDDIYYFVYRQDYQVVGYISFYIHHYLHHQHDTGEIIELIVDENYRSQKIGDQLIRHVEAFAKQLQLEEIELSTSTYRKKAHRFYEAHGYIKDHYNYTKDL